MSFFGVCFINAVRALNSAHESGNVGWCNLTWVIGLMVVAVDCRLVAGVVADNIKGRDTNTRMGWVTGLSGTVTNIQT